MSSRSKTKRLNLSRATKDLLWSESGGYCQNSGCRANLHFLVENEGKHAAEFAHIIPASTEGPRTEAAPELTEQQRAHHDNLLLLCPTCHTKIDKAPEVYPAETLRGWKRRSQQAGAQAFGTPTYTTRSDAREHVARLLGANRAVFDLYRPLDGFFDDERADQWHRHLVGTIIPHNNELVRVLRGNQHLMTPAEQQTANIFAVHARELSERHLEGNWTAGSTPFPTTMDNILKDEQ